MGETDLTSRYCGWNIDDVEVLAYDLIPPVPKEPVPELRLNPSWPNPFRDATTVVFMAPAAGTATVSIYDVSGRLVRELPGRECSAGPNLRSWDGTNRNGEPMPSGVYFVRVEAGGEASHGKVVLLR